MTKTEFLDRWARTGEERLLLSRVLDKAQYSFQRGVPAHTGFLSPAEQALVREALPFWGGGRWVLRGGYEGAERCVACFLPDWMEEEYLTPDLEDTLTAVRADLSRAPGVSHRDVLGSLMGLGMTREMLGDILIADGAAQCVLLSSALDIVLSQWESIGRYGIAPVEISLTELKVKPPELRTVKDTVAAMRLDSVLASGFSLSRSKAAELIAAGRVAVNHRECVKADKAVAQGDVLTCRGLGKCVLRLAGGLSKKGRILIEIDRYI